MMPIRVFCTSVFPPQSYRHDSPSESHHTTFQFLYVDIPDASPLPIKARVGRTGWNDGRADRGRSAVSSRGRRTRRSPAASMLRSRTCRSSARTATPIPRWYALDEPFPDPAQLLIVPDHYIFRMLFSQGVQARGSRRADAGRHAGRDRRPEDLAALRRKLSSLSRHADAALVRLCAVRPVRHRRAADGQRRPTRITTRSPRCFKTDAYRPRALFERFNIEVIATTEGALDDLQLAQHDPRQRLEGPRRHRLSPRRGGRSGFRGLCRPISTGSARSPAAIPAPGPAISTPTASAAPISRSSARPPPTTAIRPPRRPTCRMRRPRNCSTASGAARTRNASAGCSARRC